MTLFMDKSVLAGTSIRESDGALIADVRVARTGIQLYRGVEIDPSNEHGLRDRAVVRVYRSGDEVFSEDTLASLAHRTVTNDHPPEMVDSKNWKKYAVGITADEIKGEGIYVRVPLMVSDQQTIDDIQAGKREVSSGYYSQMDWTPGKTPKGESYDAAQKNIRFNHVAIVHRGRAGKAVRIGDEAGVWDDESLNNGEDEGVRTMANRTVTHDGITIEVTDQGAQVIEKLQATVRTLTDAATTAETSHRTALAAKDTELATKDAEIEKLRKQVLDQAAIDKLVADRSTLSAKARMVHKDAKIDGLTPVQIMRGVVEGKLGADVVKDKSDAYIEARFDGLVEEATKAGGKVDDFRAAVKDGGLEKVNDASKPAQTAYQKMVDEMANPKLQPVTA